MKTPVTVGLTIVSVVAVSVSGLAVGHFLSGGSGGGPEDALPRDTVAFMKLDLNPSIGQKVNLLRLASKLPDLKVPHDDLKGALLRNALDGNDLGLRYARDIEPWIGDQLAVAEVAGASPHQGTSTLLAVEYTDRAKMEAALDHAKHVTRRQPFTPDLSAYPTPTPMPTPTPSASLGAQIRCVRIGSNSQPGVNPNGVVTAAPSTSPAPSTSSPVPGTIQTPTRCYTAPAITPTITPTTAAPATRTPTRRPAAFAYAVRGSYVLIGENRAAVARAASSALALSDNPAYVANADEIDADGQIATGWADVGAAYDAATKLDRTDLLDAFGTKTRPAGTVVGGLHAGPNYIEADLATHGLRFLDEWVPVSAGQGAGLVDKLPADTSVAFEAANLGEAATRMWNRLGHTDDLFGIDDAAKSAGVRLPDDLQAVLGDDLVAGARFRPRTSSDLEFATRARTDRADRALKVLKVAGEGEPDTHGQRTTDGYVWGTDGVVYRQLLSGQGRLGQDPSFRTVIADPERADAVLFVRIQDLLRLFSVSGSDGPDSSDALDAFGVAASGTPENGRLVARLSVR